MGTWDVHPVKSSIKQVSNLFLKETSTWKKFFTCY